MTVPRADATLAQRVKKLEEEFRRIRLVPSTTQTDVAPAAAVKGAVWIDSSAGNEPKVFNGTAWVPARDETIAVAQQTADTAQATVDPLVPLTDIAAQVDGTTLIDTTQATATDGARVVINDPAYPGEVVLYSAAENEVTPARIWPNVVGSGGTLVMRSPDLSLAGTQHADIQLTGNPVGADPGSRAYVDAAEIELRAFALKLLAQDVSPTPIQLGKISDYFEIDGNAVTGADLSDLSNTFPTFPYFYAYLNANQSIPTSGTPAKVTGWVADGTPNSSGITHSAGNFTIPTTGRYKLRAQTWWAAVAAPTGTRTAQWVRVSPNNILASHSVPGNSATVPMPVFVEKTVRLTAGEEIFVQVIQGQASPHNLIGSNPDITYAQIEWVGP